MKAERCSGLTFADALRQLEAYIYVPKYKITYGTVLEDQFELWYGDDMLVYSDNESDIVAKLFQVVGVEPELKQ